MSVTPGAAAPPFHHDGCTGRLPAARSHLETSPNVQPLATPHHSNWTVGADLRPRTSSLHRRGRESSDPVPSLVRTQGRRGRRMAPLLARGCPVPRPDKPALALRHRRNGDRVPAQAEPEGTVLNQYGARLQPGQTAWAYHEASRLELPSDHSSTRPDPAPIRGSLTSTLDGWDDGRRVHRLPPPDAIRRPEAAPPDAPSAARRTSGAGGWGPRGERGG